MPASQLNDILAKYHSAIFGHAAQLSDGVPADLSLRCQVDSSQSRCLSHNWRRWPGRPRNRRLDQVEADSRIPPADL